MGVACLIRSFPLFLPRMITLSAPLCSHLDPSFQIFHWLQVSTDLTNLGNQCVMIDSLFCLELHIDLKITVMKLHSFAINVILQKLINYFVCPIIILQIYLICNLHKHNLQFHLQIKIVIQNTDMYATIVRNISVNLSELRRRTLTSISFVIYPQYSLTFCDFYKSFKIHTLQCFQVF